MPVKRKYVRKYVVGGAGIGDFIKKGWNKVTGLFRRAKPTLSRAINSDVGKALTSAGKDLAVAGIGAAKDYAVGKIADKVASRANALAQAADDLVEVSEPLKKANTLSQVVSSISNPIRKANTLSDALSGYSSLINTPSGGSIKIQRYAKKIMGSGLKKMY